MRLEYLVSTGESPGIGLRDVLKPSTKAFTSRYPSFHAWSRAAKRRQQAAAAAKAAAALRAEADAIKAALLEGDGSSSARAEWQDELEAWRRQQEGGDEGERVDAGVEDEQAAAPSAAAEGAAAANVVPWPPQQPTHIEALNHHHAEREEQRHSPATDNHEQQQQQQQQQLRRRKPLQGHAWTAPQARRPRAPSV